MLSLLGLSRVHEVNEVVSSKQLSFAVILRLLLRHDRARIHSFIIRLFVRSFINLFVTRSFVRSFVH